MPLAFTLNNCEIESLSIEPIETGCAGRFCNKQRVLEVLSYNEGCGCYSYDARRTNMVINHVLNINHHSLQETIHVSNYSSSMFSLLYQTAVFSSQIRASALDVTDEFFNLEENVENVIKLINENDGFTVIGWYKRGNVKDRTILHQNSVNENKYNSNTNDETDTVDNSKIIFHPCIIKPSNSNFYKRTSNLYVRLQTKKYNVSNLMHG